MEPRSRLTISLLMAWAAVIAIVLALPQLNLGTRIVLTPLLLVSWPWVVGPLIVYQTHWFRAEPHFSQIDEHWDELPVQATSALMEMIHQLDEAGFTFRGVGHCPGFVPWVEACVALYEHPTTGELAEATVAFTRRPIVRQHHSWVNITSRLANGAEIHTGNATALACWPSDPRKHFQGFPACWPVWRLLQIHRARVADFGVPVVGDEALGDDVCAYLALRNRDEVQWVASRGYLKLDAGQGVYRPTWRGAFLMTWRLVWPVSWVRRARRRFLAWRTVRALRPDVSPIAKKEVFLGDELS